MEAAQTSDVASPSRDGRPSTDERVPVSPTRTVGLSLRLAAVLALTFLAHLRLSGEAVEAADVESGTALIARASGASCAYAVVVWLCARLVGALACRREHAMEARQLDELARARATHLEHHRRRYGASRQLLAPIELRIADVQVERLAQRADDIAETLRQSRLSWRRYRVARLCAAAVSVWSVTFFALASWAVASSDAGVPAKIIAGLAVTASAAVGASWLVGLRRNTDRFPRLPRRAYPVVDDTPRPGAGKVVSPVVVALALVWVTLIVLAFRARETEDVLQASGISVQLVTGLLGFAGVFIAQPLARIDRFWQRSGLSRRQLRVQLAWRERAPRIVRGAGVLCFVCWAMWWTALAFTAVGAIDESEVRNSWTGIASALSTLAFAWAGIAGRDWRRPDGSTLTTDELYVRLQADPGRRAALTLLAGGFVIGSLLQLAGTLMGAS